MSEGLIERAATYPSLRNRPVLITGGAAGIGASIVEHFARQHSRVAFIDIAEEPAHALIERLAADGLARPHFVKADIRDISALKAAIADCAAGVGEFDVLVNNAGHDERHRWESVTPEYWDARVAVNLRHQFFAIQAVAPMMQRRGGGSIVNFGSTSWHIGQGGMPGYTSSKAGIEGLTRSFARDLGPDKIRVNCVLPGWIMTERQLALWVTPETVVEIDRNQCLKEKLYPPDVARLVLWLAADDSRMCTNQTWTVDGGWT
jgi:NAD(P)-dependent dehydrogenase (short-subunit alcohol dehydrogenase family)